MSLPSTSHPQIQDNTQYNNTTNHLCARFPCRSQQLDNEMPESDFASVIPAQLSFLAIYNPLLGPTDETLSDQIVFYTSRSSRSRPVQSTAADEDGEDSKDEWNARLRQIGLAQGMVDFARWE